MAAIAWIGGSGNWTDASKWNLNRAPTAADDVTINPAGTVTVDVAGAQAAHSVTMTGDDTLSLLNATLDIGAASTIAHLAVASGGRLNTIGDLSLTGASSFSVNAILAGPGKILNTGTLDLSGGPTIQTELQDTGTMTASNGTLFVSGAAAKVRVFGGGVLNLTNASLQRPNGGLGVFLESGGTLNVIGSDATGNALTVDGGVVNVVNDPTYGGSLEFSSGTLHDATFHVAGGARVVFDGTGQHNLVSGTITGTGAGQVVINSDNSFDLATDTVFNFAAGVLQFQNSPAIDGPGTLTNAGFVQGSPVLKTKVLNTGTFTPTGTLTFGSPSAELRILSGSTFDSTGIGLAGDVTSKGLIVESGGLLTGGFSSGSIPVQILGGTVKTIADSSMAFYGSTILTGALLDTSAGNQIFFQSGSTTTFSGTITGVGPAGTVVFAMGRATFNVAAGGATMDFAPGMAIFHDATINGPGVLTDAGALSFQPSNLILTTELRIVGTLKLEGANPNMTLDGAGGLLRIANGGLLLSSSNFNGHSISATNGAPGVVVESGGTLEETGGLYVNAPFDNQGTVICEGFLQFSGTVAQISGTIGNVTLTGGTWIQRDGTVSGSGMNILNVSINTVAAGASVSVGSGKRQSVFGSILGLSNNAGTVQLTQGQDLTLGSQFTNSGTLILGTGSSVDIGTYTQAPTGTTEFEIGATDLGPTARLIGTDAATLAGTARITLAAGFSPSAGQSFPLMSFTSRTGTFTTLQGGASFDPVYTNTAFSINALAGAANLGVDSINIPATGIAGQNVSLDYTVRNNASSATTATSWVDTVYLSKDGTVDSSDIVLTHVPHNGALAGNATYTSNVTVPLAAALPDSYRLIVVTDSRGQVADTDRTNNTLASSSTIAVTVPVLTLGTPVTATIPAGGELLYRVDVPPGKVVRLSANLSASYQATVITAAGRLPVAGDPVAASTVVDGSMVATTLTATGANYIRLTNVIGTAGSVTLSAQVAGLGVFSATPAAVGRGKSTITVVGAGFGADSAVTLVSGSTTVAMATVIRVDGQTLYAAFDLTAVAAGSYALRVTTGGNSADAPMPVVVSSVATALLPVKVNLVGPSSVRAFRTTNIEIQYTNPNVVDVPAPIILLASDNGLFALPGSSNFTNGSMEILGIGSTGPAGTLAPGAVGSITVKFQQRRSGPHVFSNINVYTVDPTTPIDWSTLKNDLRPVNEPLAAWDAIYANFQSAVGSTAASYQSVLDELATHLAVYGQRTADVSELMHQELAISGNFGQITSQYAPGHAGIGVYDPYNVTASVNADGAVQIGSGVQFSYYIPTAAGVYKSQLTGDTDVLTRGSDNSFILTHQDGNLVVYSAAGTLNFSKDTHGNQTTATVSNGVVTALTDATGQTTLTYNAQGNIATVTDHVGRVTSYTYDGSGNLTSLTNSLGTTTYAYANPSSHAVTQITRPDGSVTVMTYDSLGRMNSTGFADGSQTTTFAHDVFGGTTTTDSLGNSTFVAYGLTGQPVSATNAAGETVSFAGPTTGGTQTINAPDGTSPSVTFDDSGSVTGGTSANGGSSPLTYDANGHITSLTDAAGNKTTLAYDSSGSIATFTDPAGRSTGYTYDSTGKQASSTTAAGRVANTTYTATGLVASQTFSDGTSVSFTYDGHNNRLTAANAFGTETFTYDSADRLTSVTYPNGLSLTYSWNSRNQLAAKTDQSGFTTRYTYDANGRLITVSDTTGTQLAAYTYDAAGNVTRADSGNGTFTTYAYDQLSQTTQVVNHTSSGATQSSFVYTYDVNGRVKTMTTLAGTTTYTYDADGQLTRAVLPGARTIVYAYDALGNRSAVTDSGTTTTNYSANNLNQYTAVGATTYTYDADGNLLTSVNSSGTTTYSYNASQQLVSVAGPNGATTYTYDALGNRVSQTVNGVTTRELNDPVIGNQVVGLFDTNGVVQSHYAHGLGLAAQLSPAGSASYYAYDAEGNTAAVTNASGTVTNTYAYLPFGEKLSETGSAANPFTYSGRGGVFDQRDGTYLTRTRVYNASLGRFTQRDPLSLNAGDANLYRYVGNNPVNLSDASGLFFEGASINATLTYFAEFGYATRLFAADVAKSSTTGLLLELGWATEARAEVQLALTIAGNQLGSYAANTLAAETLAGIVTKAPLIAGVVESNLVTIEQELAIRRGEQLFAREALKQVAKQAAVRLVGLGTTLLQFESAAFEYNLKYNQEFPDGTPVDVQAGVNQNKLINRILKDPLGRQLLESFQSAHPGTPVTDDGLLLILQDIARSKRNLILEEKLKQEALDSGDPNEIIGTSGSGAAQYVSVGQPLVYTINFENKPSASAAAQQVFVTSTLDANVDLSTFQLRSIGFGNLTIDVPAGLQSYSKRVSYIEPGTGTSLLVDVSASLNPATRQVTWTFNTLDPMTLDLPADPATGFLPPNMTSPEGDGFVSYTARSTGNLPTGTQINAQASIVFDTNAAISTNIWTNTVDASAPTSSVSALPASQQAAEFYVNWAGEDDAGGSGISSYAVYVSDNGGAFAPWLVSTAATQGVYFGVSGHQYGFYSVATDNVGNVQSTPSAAQAQTTAGTTTLTGSITKVAASVIGGAKGGALIHLTNQSQSLISGIYSITLNLSSSTSSLDGNDAQVVTLPRVRINLRPGKSMNLVSRFRFPANLDDGTYFVLATISSGGQLQAAIGGPAVFIAKPVVDLTPSIVFQPKSLIAGRFAAVTFAVTNAGNVPAIGTLAFDVIGATSPGVTTGTVLKHLVTHINVLPRKGSRYTLVFKPSTALALTNYYLGTNLTVATKLADTDALDKSVFSTVPILLSAAPIRKR
jgi:RHS repeat-associated protein